MDHTKPKNDKSLTYIVSTLGIIFFGIILTNVINKVKSNDVRSRASATSGIQATAVILSVDADTLTVNNLTFNTNPKNNLGIWKITPPNTFSLSSVNAGSTIQITINPSLFLVSKHTLTATEIKKK